MKRRSTSLKLFAYYHDEMPAFHAGYLVVTFLIAALFNFGSFALLIAAHTTLDVFKYRDILHFSWRDALYAVLREGIWDYLLFIIGLLFAVYLDQGAGLVALSGIRRAEVTILRGIGTLIPKMGILYRFIPIPLHLREYVLGHSLHSHHPMSIAERMCFFACIVGLLLLVLSPAVISGGGETVLQILQKQILPWRI